MFDCGFLRTCPEFICWHFLGHCTQELQINTLLLHTSGVLTGCYPRKIWLHFLSYSWMGTLFVCLVVSFSSVFCVWLSVPSSWVTSSCVSVHIKPLCKNVESCFLSLVEIFHTFLLFSFFPLASSLCRCFFTLTVLPVSTSCFFPTEFLPSFFCFCSPLCHIFPLVSHIPLPT